MRIVFFGNGERGCACLERIAESVKLVVALPSDEQPSWSRKIHDVAEGLGIPYIAEGYLVYERVWAAEPDVIILAGWPKLLQGMYVDEFYCMNLHASPLPNYRGPAPMNWMLINGERQGAFSVVHADRGVDTGPIIGQISFSIGKDDTYTDLYDLSLRVFPELLRAVLNQYELRGKLIDEESPLKNEGGFWCTRRRPEDGEIRWNTMTAQEVHNLVRALTWPMPGAFSILHKDLIIDRTQLIKREYRGVPGRIAAVWPSGFVVVCKDRGILVKAFREGDRSYPVHRWEFGAGDQL